jgi:cytochrome c peroxidase
MQARVFLLFAALSVSLGALLWGAEEGGSRPAVVRSSPAQPPPSQRRDALLPLPPLPALPADKVELGRRLFFEPRLSRDDTISCAHCHDPARGGTDRMRVSLGIGGQLGQLNAPTVFNAGLNFVQFWDGRAATLEEQAAGPVHNPVEMGSNWDEVVAKLSQDAAYRDAFQRIYADGMRGENIADAIATFERSLLTPDSPFDRFLLGDETALGELERAGYRRFLDYGCASCHQGAHIGGNLFQRFGVMDDYFADRPVAPHDLGRFNVTGREADRHVFKVPSLRNVAVTPPYFHGGSAATLEDAVVIMGRYQLGRELTDEDVRALVAFLQALTGVWQGRPLP